MGYARVHDTLLPLITLSLMLVVLATTAYLLASIGLLGAGKISLEFLLSPPSYDPSEAGIMPALVGSIWVVSLAIIIAVPLGIAFSVYLVEYLGSGNLRSGLYFLVETLAGVPSVMYGIVGLGFLGYTMGAGRSLLTGAVTLAFLILPLIIVSATEALKSVPDSLRLAAYSLGASRTQVVCRVVLPLALPGATTGSILAVARALGEAAPLLVISGLLFARSPPLSPLDGFTVLPLQIFNWITRPQQEFRELAAAGILVLLAIFLALNAAAFIIRDRTTRRLQEV